MYRKINLKTQPKSVNRNKRFESSPSHIINQSNFNMEIIGTDKRTSWTERLMSLPVGDRINIDLKSCKTVSQTISRIKSINPEQGWNWTVKKIKVNGIHHHGEVTRLS